MATEEIEISQLELADEILADMVTPVETATETKAVTLSQLRKWIGSSLPTGFIIASIGKINDSRFTLLDGKTLSRTGTYEDFCNKVIEQVNAGNWFSCTQSEYDEDLSNYGQCGRFVIETDYIRIPTLGKSLCSGVINGTIPVAGNGMAIGITADPRDAQYNFTIGTSSDSDNSFKGRLAIVNKYGQTIPNSGGREQSLGLNNIYGITTDPTKSGIEGKINSVEVYYYMVVSTDGQKDPVEIDINNVYEDINLKANKDLSDVSQAGKTTVAGWGMPSVRYVDLTLGASNSIYTAPANGWFFAGKRIGGTSSTYELSLDIIDEESNIVIRDSRLVSTGGLSATNALYTMIPAKKGDVCRVQYNLAGETMFFRFVYAEGEN